MWLPVALVALLRLSDGMFDDASSASVRLVPISSGSQWVATWGASTQAATTGNLSGVGFRDATIRQIVFTSVGGARVRVRLTNAFGAAPLRIGQAEVALAARGAGTVPGTAAPLYFDGRRSLLIPPGAGWSSDPSLLSVGLSSGVSVSLYLPVPTGQATQHSDAQQVNYVATGRHVIGGPGPFRARTQSWYFLAGVDVLSPRRTLGSVIAFGDSITDGVGSRTNVNTRWPNLLASRLNGRSGETLGVVDAGIGGNRVLNAARCCGVSAIARFQRDVGEQPGARDVILLEGINDIGFSQSHGALTAPHTSVSALAIVNGSRYGNASSIFTTSGKAVRQYKYNVQAGMIGVNIGVAAPMAFFTFTGWKDSFFGDLHAHGADAIQFFTEKKVIISRWF